MGFLDSLFGGGGGKEPTPKKIANAVSILQTRHGEPARRYQAMDRLAEWATPESVDGLLVRYTVSAEKEQSDEDEKAYLGEILEKLGPELVAPALERYLRREAAVGRPLAMLKKIASPEDFRRRAASVLADLDIHFDRHPERKVEILATLEEHAKADEVREAVLPFLDDTDDTVRIAAIRLLVQADAADVLGPIIDCLAGSGDRPRVLADGFAALAASNCTAKGRKAEIEPLLPEGFYLTRDGAVKRLGKA